ncbi:MAG: NACHT domain-containing protein [Candidatus Viridilinea halotolerans]|uniref:NACHT domain-containing protein n=1 Tax=Candidatus Viridilinea halotolerans TaxID=2491704 RepID=A0A426TYE9_9CHLR|nr:MAG: NACHT domain-containing protein [Candidatus Viridilinea halotolerans]
MFSTALTAVITGLFEAAGGELWQRFRQYTATRQQHHFDAAVQAAYHAVVAADPKARAALELFAQPSPERQKLLQIALEELLFSANPNHGRLNDAYRRQIGYLALLREQQQLPPWPAVEPHLNALIKQLRTTSAADPVLAILNLNPVERAQCDAIIATRRASEATVNILQRIDERLLELCTLLEAPSPNVEVNINADHGSSIAHTPVQIILDAYRNLQHLTAPDLEQLYTSYRNLLRQTYTNLGIHAFVQLGEATTVPLNQVYVNLTATRLNPSVPGQQPILPLHDLVRDIPNLVLLGSAGSGKTTLIRRLILALVEGDAHHHFDLTSAMLPMVFPLAAFTALPNHSTYPSPLSTLRDWFAQQQEPDYTPLLHRALITGNAFVIFDGLDELASAAERTMMRTTIEQFMRTWSAPGNRFLVTSRPLDYTAALLDGRLFTHAKLEPLTPAQRQQMVVAYGSADAAKRLHQTLACNPVAREMARSPLLLMLMLALANRGEDLPTRRTPLIARCFQLLAEGWRRERPLHATVPPPLDPHTNQAISADLIMSALGVAALRVRSKRSPRVTQHDNLFRHLKQVRHDLYAVPRLALEGDAKTWLTLVAQHTDLIRLDQSTDSINAIHFIHPSFREYCAGRALVAVEVEADQITTHGHTFGGDPAWRELFCHALASAPPDVAEELLEALLDAEDDPTTPGSAALNAGAALAERDDATLDPGLRRATLNKLINLLADPQPTVAIRVEAGHILGRLGDPRLLDPSHGEARGHPHGELPSYWCPLAPGTLALGDARDHPLRPVELTYSYQIGRYPVSNAEFQHFLAANGSTGYDLAQPWWTPVGRTILPLLQRSVPKFWHDWRYTSPSQPVVGITWYEAVAYAQWLSVIGHQRGWLEAHETLRLPTWIEWEYAARAPHCPTYPWGNTPPTATHANYSATAIWRPTPVGCFPQGAAACGAHDMAGNVLEWIASAAVQPWATQPLTDSNPSANVLVADSSFSDLATHLHCGARASAMPECEDENRGFRLVRIARATAPDSAIAQK